MKHYDIAIIGYGPVGAVTANLFAKQGFTIALIEPKLDIWDIPVSYTHLTLPTKASV